MQLIVCIIIAVVFFIVLISTPDLRNNIYADKSLLLLCGFIWALLIAYLIGIFFDFYRLSSFDRAEEYSELQRYMEQSGGMLNRFSCDALLNSEEVSQILSTVGCAMLEIKNLPAINASEGRDAGDQAIKDFCEMLESVGNDYGIVVRNGGNEFLIVVADCTAELMDQCLDLLDNSVSVYNEAESAVALDIHQTYVLNSDHHFDRFSEVITLAYKQLHSN